MNTITNNNTTINNTTTNTTTNTNSTSARARLKQLIERIRPVTNATDKALSTGSSSLTPSLYAL